MRHARELFAIMSIASLAACVKDAITPDHINVKLVVKAVWNGEAFDKNTVYLNAANERVLVQLVQFFLADISLTGSAQPQQLSEVELLNVTDSAWSNSYTLPYHTYSGLHFGLGLPYDLNHSDPVLFPVEDPLGANSGMYWSWASLRRFLLFDGRFDSNTDTTGTPPYLFSIHTGHDECYRERTIDLPSTVFAADTTRITLTVDIARFFHNATDTLDLSQGSQSHGAASELPLALKLSDLARDAFRVQ